MGQALPLLRLLHVDNSAEDLFALSRVLKQQQEFAYTLNQFHSLDELGAWLTDHPDNADVLLVDLGLDDSDGLETVERSLALAHDLPIIPLTGLTDNWVSLNAIQLGIQDYLVKGTMSGPTLARALHYAVERHKLVRKLNEAYAREAHLATHDYLTGLGNRAFFEQQINDLLMHAERQHAPFAVLFLDLDHFKLINDTQGHAVGDALLCHVAHCIRAQLRRSDFVARLGGDEFICVLRDIEHPVNAAQIAEKIISAISAKFTHLEKDYHLGASIGIALWPKDGDDSTALAKNADTALYFAKQNGRGQFSFFNKEMHQSAMDRFNLEQQMREALAKNEFVLYYQPLVNHLGALLSCEALLRWQHPKRGFLLPAEFIEQAEESGIIIDIGEYVLRHAIRQHKRWQEDNGRQIPIAVNISPRHLVRSNFITRLNALLEEAGLSPGQAPWLTLEITERVFFEPTEQVLLTLRQLSDMGVQIAIDDFGTGYSSLYYLKELPINTLKIDRIFVQNLGTSANDRRLLRALIAIGDSMELRIVAEGVETEEQRACLEENQCGVMQGFLFAPALPPEALLAYTPEVLAAPAVPTAA